MHCLRAAVALMAAMMFSLSAAGQTSRAIAVYTGPAGGMAPTIQVQPLAPAAYATTIKRYGDPNKGDLKIILGVLEYDIFKCTLIDSGTWTDPNPVQAKDKNGTLLTLGTVDFTHTFKATLKGTVGGRCDGVVLDGFRAIKFIWTLHSNFTMIPKSGPTAVFNSSWSSKDHCCDVTITFSISVPVVRPKGEITTFTGWSSAHGVGRGTYGRWLMTLQCCDAGNNGDPDFDFNGEMIKEKFVKVTNTCADRAPGVLGGEDVTPSGPETTWNVGKLKINSEQEVPAGKNVWGYDYLGFLACNVFAYRCARVTEPPCGITIDQGITIKSPADPVFTDPLYNNVIGEGIGGRSYLPTFGDGPFTSKRISPTSGTGGEEPFPGGVTSSEFDCVNVVLSILRARPGSCVAPLTH
jgi:hypothetical protein